MLLTFATNSPWEQKSIAAREGKGRGSYGKLHTACCGTVENSKSFYATAWSTHTHTSLVCLSQHLSLPFSLCLSPSPSLSLSLTLELIHTLINIQKVLCVCSPETGSAFYAMYLLPPYPYAASLCQHNLYQPQLFSFPLSLSLCVSPSSAHLTFSCVDIWKCVAHNFNSICSVHSPRLDCLSLPFSRTMCQLAVAFYLANVLIKYVY